MMGKDTFCREIRVNKFFRYFCRGHFCRFSTTKIGVLDLFIFGGQCYPKFSRSPTCFGRKHFCCDFTQNLIALEKLKSYLKISGKNLNYQFQILLDLFIRLFNTLNTDVKQIVVSCSRANHTEALAKHTILQF